MKSQDEQETPRDVDRRGSPEKIGEGRSRPGKEPRRDLYWDNCVNCHKRIQRNNHTQ